MRAVYIQSHGKSDSAVIGEKKKPQPTQGQVRLKVAYAAFNHVDLYMRQSGFGIRHELPLTLGVDCAGSVDALGPGIDSYQTGDRVVVYPAQTCGHCEYCRAGQQMLCLQCQIIGEHIDGSFADYVCVQASSLFAVPDSMPLEQAAALPTAYLTAWRMVKTQAQLQPGQTVLIHGVGGGVALASLQLAKLAGARVAVTSSSETKLAKAGELGADCLIHYGRENVLDTTMDFTRGRGVDLVIDNVGEATWPTSLRAVRRGGRVVTCGATSGGLPGADLQRVFIRQIQIFGSTLGTHEEFRSLIEVVSNQQIKPVIERVIDFDAALEALDYLEQAKQCGKLLLKVG